MLIHAGFILSDLYDLFLSLFFLSCPWRWSYLHFAANTGSLVWALEVAFCMGSKTSETSAFKIWFTKYTITDQVIRAELRLYRFYYILWRHWKMFFLYWQDGVVKKESGVNGGETSSKRARLSESFSCLESTGLLTVRTGNKLFSRPGSSTPTTPPDLKQPPFVDSKLQPLVTDSKLQPLLENKLAPLLPDSKTISATCLEQAEDLSSKRQPTPTPLTPPTPPPHPVHVSDNNNTSTGMFLITFMIFFFYIIPYM